MASRRLLTLTLPPVVIGYGIHYELNVLESKYPAIPPESSTSLALRTPRNSQTQHCGDIDVYSARVPLRALQHAKERRGAGKATTPQDEWARTLLNSPTLRTEASLIGLFTTGRFTPGDTGNTPGGLNPEIEPGVPRKLLNGVFTVQRPPSPDPTLSNENSLLVSWEIPPVPREFFERIARWGYPWRLMSGGRHEISVSRPDTEGDEIREPFVEVRFASAHDYETVSEEGGLEKQKTIPGWTGRLHRGYARWVLDSAVQELKSSSNVDF